MMGISRSTYYANTEEKILERAGRDTELRDHIEAIHLDFPTYGYRRLQAELARRGIVVNHKKLKRVMKEHGLRAVKFRQFVHTTDSNHCYHIYPNLAQEFNVTDINQLWVTDITYIRIATCFVYLSAILDRYSRRVVGWAISRNIDRELCLASLKMAIEARKPPPGCIHHSDRGVQYASHDYVAELVKKGFKISMSRKGNPYDNAFAESFWKTIKYEEVHLFNYETYEEVLDRVPFFIEEVYNRKRLHSSLGYIPPVEFEERLMLR
jgi:transposase InsO family protein